MTNADRTYSFEFFPPKTDKGVENLKATRAKLAKLKPEYFSCTFGAGGSTRDRTFETVVDIQEETSIDAAPHLSCIDSTRDNIAGMLQGYHDKGIQRLVALRGDIPSGTVVVGEFRYANELVSYIRETTGDHFHIEVAAYPEIHPQANSARDDLINFKRKIDAGANSAITQYFYNADAYFRFVDGCRDQGVDIPIIPGIMPITNYVQLARFSEMCGAEIPRWLRKRLADFGDDMDSLKAFGIDVVTEMCRQLLDGGAPGLHFYTLNQASASIKIWDNLSLSD
ncbi:MAG TPA: methylenetetrahydrofolate reductase [NAD(P)H] [Chromatiales bacterium]|nr:methylenetetrahydrofolate reductase [NAD(P)H] [Chromatiales bacterium]